MNEIAAANPMQDLDRPFDGDAFVSLVRPASAAGIDLERVLASCDLAGFDVLAQRGLSGQELHSLIYRLKFELDDVFLGFMKEPAKRFAFELALSPMKFHCLSLGEALKAHIEARTSVRNDVSYELMEADDSQDAILRMSYETQQDADRALFHWLRMCTLVRYYSWLIGRRILLRRATFVELEPKDLRVRQKYTFFDCDLSFEQSYYSITFDRRFLQCPVLRKGEAEQADYFASYADWFVVPGGGASWKRKAEEVVRIRYAAGNWMPPIADIADELGIDARSLRRWLAKDGTSFTEIRNTVRSEIAMALLAASELPVSIVATETGYADPANFTRAFFARTGLNPSEYRHRYSRDKLVVAQAISKLSAFRSA